LVFQRAAWRRCGASYVNGVGCPVKVDDKKVEVDLHGFYFEW